MIWQKAKSAMAAVEDSIADLRWAGLGIRGLPPNCGRVIWGMGHMETISGPSVGIKIAMYGWLEPSPQ
ncbi:hypothetical protein CU669_16695 [Paramagnetospirillum kuznetsovii]|uniref:Uncharacterized protein n=1 Tax=Paramagnetospirillum kuznetsovii TaxID=2053833 RepID=A0A364NV03_9PROT|nr:hypothetical protein CU669_16695 [Paramagnetospirillum kuznetsovii]